MYKIIDNDGMGTHADEKFKTKKEIVEHLANYHDIDFTGSDDKDNELDIWEYFKFWKINTVEKQLVYLMQYGEWEIEKV
jgi:hypothetical protein